MLQTRSVVGQTMWRRVLSAMFVNASIVEYNTILLGDECGKFCRLHYGCLRFNCIRSISIIVVQQSHWHGIGIVGAQNIHSAHSSSEASTRRPALYRFSLSIRLALDLGCLDFSLLQPEHFYATSFALPQLIGDIHQCMLYVHINHVLIEKFLFRTSHRLLTLQLCPLSLSVFLFPSTACAQRTQDRAA